MGVLPMDFWFKLFFGSIGSYNGAETAIFVRGVLNPPLLKRNTEILYKFPEVAHIANVFIFSGYLFIMVISAPIVRNFIFPNSAFWQWLNDWFDSFFAGTYCGQMRNLVVFSTHNQLYVTFQTLKRTAQVFNRGFYGVYEFSEDYVKLGKGFMIRSAECWIGLFGPFYE